MQGVSQTVQPQTCWLPAPAADIASAEAPLPSNASAGPEHS